MKWPVFYIRFPPPPDAQYDPEDDCWYTSDGEVWGKKINLLPLVFSCLLFEGAACLLAYWVIKLITR